MSRMLLGETFNCGDRFQHKTSSCAEPITDSLQCHLPHVSQHQLSSKAKLSLQWCRSLVSQSRSSAPADQRLRLLVKTITQTALIVPLLPTPVSQTGPLSSALPPALSSPILQNSPQSSKDSTAFQPNVPKTSTVFSK